MIAEKFHYTFDQIAALTPRQTHTILFHPRDKEGRIRFPEDLIAEAEAPTPPESAAGVEVTPETTPEQKLAAERKAKLAALDELYGRVGLLTKGQYEAAKRQVNEKYPLPVSGDGQSQ